MTAYPKLSLFIAGEQRAGDGRDELEVTDPATGATLGKLPVAREMDIDDALASVAEAFPAWAATPAFDRYRLLRAAAALLRDRTPELAPVLSMEQGKTLAEAQVELSNSADVFDWYAEEGRRNYGRVIPERFRNTRMLVRTEPIGPVAAFTPWNFPAVIPARKIAAALAAGCTCIFKPAEETPAAGLALARALHDAGLPAGVLNVVFGDPDMISRRVIASGIIRKFSFTGSVGVGRHLARLAADNLVKATLELGGHAPVVVCDDADVEAAASLSVASKFRNAGQVCVSPTRFFVHEDVYDRFSSSFVERAAQLKVGPGLESGVEMGALTNERRRDAISQLVTDAVEQGARPLLVEPAPSNTGNFLRPAVLGDTPDTARVMREEPFGPVAVLSRYRSLEEVIARSNSLPYALAAFAFTTSSAKVRELGDGLEAGMVGINTFAVTTPESPFGGMKDSGYGSEGGPEGLAEFTHSKFIHEA